MGLISLDGQTIWATNSLNSFYLPCAKYTNNSRRYGGWVHRQICSQLMAELKDQAAPLLRSLYSFTYFWGQILDTVNDSMKI